MSVRPSFLTATRMIGRSLGSNLSISGSSQSSGSEPSARLTLLRTSAVAKSMSRSSSNSTTMTERPS